MTTLAGHHAVVTGGGRGIGRATARALTHAGAVVTVMGRTAGTLIDAVDRGDASAYVVADVTDVVSVDTAMAPANDDRNSSPRQLPRPRRSGNRAETCYVMMGSADRVDSRHSGGARRYD